MIKTLRDTFVRIDGRSLGLFRLLFGCVLFADWASRYRWIKEFYSNDGVLPNHNHLFLLHDQTRVWSALHSFNSPEEATFAFWLVFIVYAFFLVGYKTRGFHFLSLVCLVSLTGRNILLENSGNYLAIGLLAFTLFLPLGTRFSVDALIKSMAARDEKDGSELSELDEPTEEDLVATRQPGWSPVSVAALGTMLQIAVVFFVQAVQRKGSWNDGKALHYALGGDLFVSQVGISMRSLPEGLLSLWTRAIRVIEFIVPIAMFVPIRRRLVRTIVIGAVLFYGLTFGLLFELGLFGWSIVAAAALLIPQESWDERLKPVARRRVTVIYDADCGVCLWLCRLLKRLDMRSHLAFQGNDMLDELVVRLDDGVGTEPMPEEVTPELVLDTVVAVTEAGDVFTRGQAVAAIVEALPLGFVPAFVMRLPGVRDLVNELYLFIAAHRQRISVLMGKDACGIPASEPPPKTPVDEDTEAGEVAPVVRALRILSGGVREILSVVVLLAMIAQTSHANRLPQIIPLSQPLAAVSQWPRMLGRWNVFTPEPPKENGMFVVDAMTRDGLAVDTLTGDDPNYDIGGLGGLLLGQLWSDYLNRVHQSDWSEFQHAFRDYLAKGGPRWNNPIGGDGIVGFDAYWVVQDLPAPGDSRDPEDFDKEKLFGFGRGGRSTGVIEPRRRTER